MSTRREPPGNDEGRSSPRPAAAAESDNNSTINTTNPTTNGRLCSADTVSQLRRRRHATWRLPTLDCGCGPDPISCRCSTPPLSAQMIDAGRDAALHLLTCNTVLLVKFEVLQALWRRGGADRVLAELLHEACGGEIS
jgi:hypothetical protein